MLTKVATNYLVLSGKQCGRGQSSMCVNLTASCPLNNIQVGTIADRAPEDEIFTSEESI
jgi:hypothetical protein